jgi:D-alanyl-D-alanine dipeptidase
LKNSNSNNKNHALYKKLLKILSLGSTVDLTILDSKKSSLKEIQIGERELTNGEKILFLDDGTVDMGSSFDLLNEASHHDTSLVKSEFSKMRNYLRKIMKNNGFDEYQKEWWHYTLQNEPFPDTYFNFEIE